LPDTPEIDERSQSDDDGRETAAQDEPIVQKRDGRDLGSSSTDAPIRAVESPPPPPPEYEVVTDSEPWDPDASHVGIQSDPVRVSSIAPADGRLSRAELRRSRSKARLRSEALLRLALTTSLALVVLVGVLVAVLGTGTSGLGGGLPLPAPNTALAQRVDPSTVIADPMVLVGKNIDYMYTSENGDAPPHIPVRTFTTLGQWGPPVDAMPTQPAWAGPWLWNPDVRYVEGRYVMWFTGPDLGHSLPRTGAMPRCLGWATSKSPLGPFIPSSKPAVCQFNQYGSIDPRTLVTPGGQEWLYWKSDDNAVLSEGKPTIIWAQRLAANGITLLGKPIDLMSNSRPWEGHIVESPQMVLADGHYYLFFSGNMSGSTLNGIGLATCAGPAGPCDNSSDGPWLGSNTLSQGLGEESFFTQNGKTWLMYSPTGAAQTLAVALVAFGPSGPYVAQFQHLPSVG
jgi:hypothetical protein